MNEGLLLISVILSRGVIRGGFESGENEEKKEQKMKKSKQKIKKRKKKKIPMWLSGLVPWGEVGFNWYRSPLPPGLTA